LYCLNSLKLLNLKTRENILELYIEKRESEDAERKKCKQREQSQSMITIGILRVYTSVKAVILDARNCATQAACV